jgi:hypothetical protein
MKRLRRLRRVETRRRGGKRDNKEMKRGEERGRNRNRAWDRMREVGDGGGEGL